MSVVALVGLGLAGATPASAQTPPLAIATPLSPTILIGSATCPGGPTSVSLAGLDLAGVSVGALAGSCSDTGATASAASITTGSLLGSLGIGAVSSTCTVDGTSSSSVVLTSALGGLSGTVTTPQTVVVIAGFLTVNLNVDTSTATTTGKIAVQIVAGGTTTDIAAVSCAIGVYPMAISSVNAAAPGLPAPAGHSSGASFPEMFLIAAGGVFLLANFAGFKIFRRRRAE
ncbi:MAG TPA: hypothetical protein VHT30_12255 [Acidimicrobiales bacterium]|jgi:hypothetical protein|nr:hypothetical protein [Acidimicrobiales bacterium]